MRRANPISVRVRAPSSGLVTRLPGESADQLRPGDEHKVAFVAQNMRYEDGVMRNAPGYGQVKFLSSLVTGAIAHWRFDEAVINHVNRVDVIDGYDLVPIGGGTPLPVGYTTGLLGNAAYWAPFNLITGSFPSRGEYLASGASPLVNVYSGSFSVSMWIKLDATGLSETILTDPAFEIVNLPGQIAFNVWNGAQIQATTPASSISNGVWNHIVCVYNSSAHTITIYLNGAAGTPVSVTGTLSAHYPSANQFVFGSFKSAGLALDSTTVWNRAITGTEVTRLYDSGSALDFPFLYGPFSLLYQANLIGTLPKPLVGATGGNILFLDRSFDGTTNTFQLTPSSIFSGSTPSTGYPWFSTDLFDVIVFAQHDNVAQYWKPPLPAVCAPIPGLPVTDDQWDGTEVFFGHVLLWKSDRLKWSDTNDYTTWIPVGQTAASAVLTVATGGYVQPSPGGTVTITVNENPSALGLVVGQFVTDSDGVGGFNFYQITAVTTTTITVRLQDLTGITAPTTTIPANTQIFTVNANEAGETRVVGSKMNGEIFRIVAMGDFCYIFKERSIQSMQYVGQASGTFFIHPEVSDEGLLSRTALLNLGDGRLVFLGHKELYLYTGGPNPQPICQQFTRQLIREIDRTRLQEIVMTHKEVRHEVWVTYPVVGGQKTLVWNYIEDSASVDLYDASLKGFTASADVDFSTDPPWFSLADSLTWENMDDTISWLDMAGSSNDRILLLASGDGQVLVWGLQFDRSGRAYISLSETMDFDFDEPDIFKYVDVVVLGLQIFADDNQSRLIYIQVGQKVGLGQSDADIVWTTPTAVSVSGSAPLNPVKVNPGGAGRYLRLRFYSQDADVEWEISSFEVHCRPGGFY